MAALLEYSGSLAWSNNILHREGIRKLVLSTEPASLFYIFINCLTHCMLGNFHAFVIC